MLAEAEIFALLPGVSRTFALSIRALLPGSCKRALKKGRSAVRFTAPKSAPLASDVALAYLLCRLLDTIEDDTLLPVQKRARLLTAFGRALAASSAADPAYAHKALALLDSVVANSNTRENITATPAEKELLQKAPGLFARLDRLIPAHADAIRCHASEMAFGMAESVRSMCPSGIASRRIATGKNAAHTPLCRRSDLDHYCHYVAGTVGAMLTKLFIAQVPHMPHARAAILHAHSESFARGLQLVNILKDCCKDFTEGRVFIPREIVRASGLRAMGVIRKGGRAHSGAADGLDYEAFFSEDREASARRHAALLPLLQDALGDLSRAGIYTRALPRKLWRARLFCVLPIVLARATLKLLMLPPEERDHTHPNISRRRVRFLAIASLPAAISNTWVRVMCR